MGMGATIGSAAGAGSEAVIGLIGHMIANGQREAAEALYDEVIRDAKGIDIPEFENLIAQEVEKQKEVVADPAVREAQMGALGKMRQLGESGGLDAQAQQSLQQARQSIDQQARANQMGVQSQMQRRGMSGSGAELAAQLGGAQAASVRGNEAGLGAAADARARALKALSESSGMAGQIRAGDFSEGSANRAAEAERQRFNANLRTAAQRGNIDQRYKRMEAQGEKVDRLGRLKGAKAGRKMGGADKTEQVWSGVGRGVNKLATAAGEGWDDYMSARTGGLSK